MSVKSDCVQESLGEKKTKQKDMKQTDQCFQVDISNSHSEQLTKVQGPKVKAGQKGHQIKHGFTSLKECVAYIMSNVCLIAPLSFHSALSLSLSSVLDGASPIIYSTIHNLHYISFGNYSATALLCCREHRTKEQKALFVHF